jgi:hypothetical protein
MHKLRLRDIQIDASIAAWINENYYENNVGLPFRTEAMMSIKYSEAFAYFLSLLYNTLLDNANNGRDRTIMVVELGARGIYFAEKVYFYIKYIDKRNNTNIAENVEYKIVDISPAAIKAASEEYKNKSSNLFTTEFYIADVLNNRELSSVGGNNFMAILNELVDDLPQMVVTRIGDTYYEVLYKPKFDPDYGQIRLARNGLRKLSDEEAKMFADYESMLKSGKLEEGYAVTFSPVLNTLVENISRLLSYEGNIFIHDYFIRKPVPLRLAHNLRRIYGYNLMPSALYCSIEESGVQITADVNLQQLITALGQKGFDAQAIPHRFFVNEYTGVKEISLLEIAASLNATPKEEKRLLLEKISKHMPGVNINAPNINKELLSVLKNVFRSFDLDSHSRFTAPDIGYRIDIMQDETKRNVAEELYNLCKNYPIVNPFMDIIAYRRK